MSKNSDSKIIFVLLCLEGAVISFNTASVAAVIPQIAQDLYKSSFEIARIISFYMIPYGISALFYAPLVKRCSIKAIKIFCLLVFSLGSLAGGLSISTETLFLARILTGIAASATVPVALILTGQLAPKEIRGRLVGAFFSATFISSFLGVLLSGVLHWRQLFILPAVFGAINLILVILFFDFRSKADYDFEVSYLRALKDTRILKLFVYILLLSVIYHGIYNWLGVYFASLNLSQSGVSVILSLVGFSGIFGQPFGGLVSDKKGRLFAATLGLVLLSLAALLLTASGSLYYLALVLFVFGLGWTINHNAVSTILTDFPDRLRPELASLNSAVRFAGGGLGVGLAGIFVQKSFTLTFLGLGIIILCLAGITNRILKFS